MLNKKTIRGYKKFFIPSGLTPTQDKQAPSPIADFKLIHQDRSTLIWRQRLDSGELAVIKLYRERGPVTWSRGKLFEFRVQREFHALSCLAQNNIPCSQPLFWSYDTHREHGRYEILATTEIPEALSLREVIESPKHCINDHDIRRLYLIVARMHNAGFHHGALYARNVLLSHIGTPKKEFHIIDAPKAIAYSHSIFGSRMALIDLLDLSQSLGTLIGIEHFHPFLTSYGLSEYQTQHFLTLLRHYTPSKHTRNRNRAECEFRELLDKIAPRPILSDKMSGNQKVPKPQYP